MSEVVDVHVQEDHLAKLIRPTRTTAAIAELIWNALDADATEVRVKVIENDLGGIEAVVVEDNGHGISLEDARAEFGSLGGSWKKDAQRSRSLKRILHGSEGEGRWRAYALGNRVRWRSVSRDGGTLARVEIEGRRDNLGRFTVEGPTSTDDRTGTVVTIDQIAEPPKGLLGYAIYGELAAVLAPYLEQYPVTVIYRGVRIDPTSVQTHRAEYDLDLEDAASPAKLLVIEWSQEYPRSLFLCDENGAALEELPPRIQAPGFEFTAYAKWHGFREHQDVLLLADLGAEPVGPVVEAARNALREHFRNRSGVVSQQLIEEWKQEDVYPFTGEAATTVEAAERDLFDVVALAAAPAVNRSADRSAKKLTLTLLREALEQSPESLQRVMGQVLDLSKERLEELDALLRRTPLTALITAAKKIADRLDFLAGLEALLFDPESTATLLERAQLHRILVNETWIFGEEFNLMADDESLTTVLKQHLQVLGREELAPDEPVRDEQGRPRIVDLLLGRALRHNRDKREHLVVELKRPNVTLGAEELTQIERYAYAVAHDQRFDKTNVEWDFVLVGNDWDSFAEQRAHQTGKPPGLISESEGVRVWVKTWAQVLAENEHRLKFVQESLEYAPTRDHALDYLRETHSKYLPSALRATSEESGGL